MYSQKIKTLNVQSFIPHERSCILHYLSLSDKPWRKCPICFESIYKHDLKSVRVIKNKSNFKLGDVMHFNLMFKSKVKSFNALILPINVFEQYKQDIALANPTTSHDEKASHTRKQNLFTNLNKKYVDCEQYFKLNCKNANDIYENGIVREKHELKTQIDEEKHQPEVCFAEEAMRLLEERELALLDEIKIAPTVQTAEKKLSQTITTTPITQSQPLAIQRPSVVYMDAFEEILSTEETKKDLEPEHEPVFEPEPEPETEIKQKGIIYRKS